ncbi:hypothetical protein [Lederbergia galactosidilytica]|uniref:Uncharacterized protein n=1 Tax=Lederbergia galactosidilytica TaxID=217031 RepID=A0A178A435_9BACI|nr:hypothetical protein [Lederbergia galactosidilytica]OAK73838.1 hypothetical protein ABB05_05200 [Lederbergia galactosidilytica]
MSLIETSFSEVVWKQFTFKRKAFFTTFGTLVILQLLAILFSSGGSASSGFSGKDMSVHLSYYSGDIVVIFTILWAFFVAIFITSQAARFDDYAFVGNRVSSHLANLLFLITASLIGGLSATLCGYIVRIFGYYSNDLMMGEGFLQAPLDFLLSIGAISLYGFLFATLGYLFGVIIQFHRSFVFLLPAICVGLMISAISSGYDAEMKAIFDFIVLESHFWLFLLKVFLLSGVFFAIAMGISNKLEVRK